MVESIQRRICLHKPEARPEEESAPAAASPVTVINPAIKKHFELQIKTLQTAPRDVGKLSQIIKEKEKRRDDDTSMHVEDIQDLATEIEMLKVVLILVKRENSSAVSTK